MGNQQILHFITAEYHNLLKFAEKKLYYIEDIEPEDLLQDVVVTIANKADVSAPLDNLAGYVYTSIKNKIIDTIRKIKPTLSLDREHETDENSSSLMDMLYDIRFDTYSETEKEELKRALFFALDMLEEKDRAIITATEFEEKTFKELAHEWETPMGTLLSRKSRAMEKLKQLLLPYV